MARHAQNREDMLRDAKAFVHRIELRATAESQPEIVFAGFRANGAASVYFDFDLAYHFNSGGELRRAYWDGQLIKAEQNQLVSLRTCRTEAVVEMRRHEMTASEQKQFCDTLTSRLQKLAEILQRDQYEVTGAVPNNSEVIERLRDWLQQFNGVHVADAPRVS